MSARRRTPPGRLQGSGCRRLISTWTQIIAVARAIRSCEAIHPGYGFLSRERGEFARRLRHDAGLCVRRAGPPPHVLDLFGDKAQRACRLAARCLVCPFMPRSRAARPAIGRGGANSCAALGAGGAVMVKAIAGGGGRGMRRGTDSIDDMEAAFERCRSEALQPPSVNGDLYVERAVTRGRATSRSRCWATAAAQITAHLWERECSLQRQLRRRLVEIAPAPNARSTPLRERLIMAGRRCGMARRASETAKPRHLRVSGGRGSSDRARRATLRLHRGQCPRLQVEHTVTEEITGVDLVQAQLRTRGRVQAHSKELGLDREDSIPAPRGIRAADCGVNMPRRLTADGTVRPRVRHAGGFRST